MQELRIQSFGGMCPVEAESIIGAFPFYFHSRGQHWSLSIANGDRADPVAVACGDRAGWSYEETWGEDELEAGYMPREIAVKCIERAANKSILLQSQRGT